MERWPTIADLAKADIEEVNAAWRGLGYYRRARSLLAGAKTVMGEPKYNGECLLLNDIWRVLIPGRLPKDPAVLEKHVDGVGRYTAGAITSMAYGVRTPIVSDTRPNLHALTAGRRQCPSFVDSTAGGPCWPGRTCHHQVPLESGRRACRSASRDEGYCGGLEPGELNRNLSDRAEFRL